MFILLLWDVHAVISFPHMVLVSSKRVEDFSQDLMVFCYPAGKMANRFVPVIHHRATLTTSIRPSPGTCCAPRPAAPTGTASASSPQSTTAPYLLVSYINTRSRRNHGFPSSLTWCLCSVRFSPPGSGSLPRRDGRDEESCVHGAQSPRSHQQLSVCRLADMSPAHPHQVIHTHRFFDLSGFFLNWWFTPRVL